MRLACVQTDVVFGDVAANVARTVEHLEGLAARGVDLALFPEAALNGYAAATAEETRAIAIAPDGLGPVVEGCRRTGVAAFVGFLLREGEAVFNAAALIDGNGEARLYRKTHLPWMGADRFCAPGDALTVWDTPLGRLGGLICFDLRFPEAARTLALQGAELLMLPTNWPEGAEVSADHVAITRAAENRMFVAACNRAGTERGVRFLGRSKIVDLDGRVLAAAGDGEEVLIADVDLALARQKRRVLVPGEYEIDVFARRPELYASKSS